MPITLKMSPSLFGPYLFGLKLTFNVLPRNGVHEWMFVELMIAYRYRTIYAVWDVAFKSCLYDRCHIGAA